MPTPERPSKPRPDFPLYAHRSGQWAKKIRGSNRYFGTWSDDPQGERALRKYLREKDYLQAGLAVPVEESLTLGELCNRFLDAKQDRMNAGKLSARTVAELHKTCIDLSKSIGKRRPIAQIRPDDFARFHRELGRRLGPTQMGNTVQRVRSVFKFAFDNELIDKPVRFGTEFRRPSRMEIRQVRNSRGPRMFGREELLAILGKADGQLRAMILLGIQAGFGATDCASLPRSAVDLAGGWIDYPRPKTAVRRRVPMWVETVEALRAVMDRERKPAKDPADDDLVFLTKYGHRWTRMKRAKKPESGKPGWVAVDSVALQFNKLLKDLTIKRPGLSFYALRHGFETVGAEAGDDRAVSAIMGHADESMSARYLERFPDERLLAVVNHIHDWLWPKLETEGEAE